MDFDKVIKNLLNDPKVSKDEKTAINVLLSAVENLESKNMVMTSINNVIPDLQTQLSHNLSCVKEESKAVNDVVEIVREELRQNYSDVFAQLTSDSEARKLIENTIYELCVKKGLTIKDYTNEETIDIVKKEILDFGVLTDLIFDYARDENEKIEEIRVNDWNDIKIVVNGKEESTDLKFESPQKALVIAEKICRNSLNSSMIKKDNPFVRIRMSDSIRVSIMRDTIARRGNTDGSPVVHYAIRKQKEKPFPKNFLINNGTIDEYGFELLESIIKYGVSVAFYGGTNSGKTATMRGFLSSISDKTRTFTVAEIDEMNLRKVDKFTGKATNNVVMWEINEKIGMGFRELVNASLTFSPETLILQEIKGAETVEVVDASTTGHQVITTLHAGNIKIFGKRVLSMYKQSGSDLQDHLILDLVANAFPVVARMKLYKDGRRRLCEIGELVEYNKDEGFKINILSKFEIINTIEKIDKNGNMDIEIEGKFKAINFPSKQLQESLLENAMPRSILESLENKYNYLKEDNKIEN